MKRVFVSIMAFIILSLGNITAFAETTIDKVNATFEIPKITMFDDLAGAYDLTATLRMTFPDICFNDNVELLDNIINGKREYIIKDANAKEISSLYGTRLYLLPLQLKTYDYETYKIGMMNPYFEKVVNGMAQKPTMAKKDLLQMQILNYNELGMMEKIY